MQLPKNLGMVLLGVFLILWGLLPFISLPPINIVLSVLAIIAGVLILLQHR